MTQPPHASSASVVTLYERRAHDWARLRGRTLLERAWIDRFLALVPAGGTVLDVGCGSGEPIARYVLGTGRQVVGVDSSPTLIDICRTRMPEGEWIVSDMRELALRRRFDGILAWDSFFHLTPDDQRGMFPRFAAHARPGAALMFTSGGARAGEVIAEFCGEPLYHSSLGPAEYKALLAANGFAVEAYVPEDPQCGEHTVWLARYGERGDDQSP